MSEKLHKHEFHNKQIENSPHNQLSRETNNEKLVEYTEHVENKIEKLRSSIEHEATSKSEHQKRNFNNISDQENSYHHHYITKKIKAVTYNKTLNETRKSLSKPQQILSKIIHQPVVESVSEIGAKTVARPSGILSGGIVGFFGSTLLIFFAKDIGFELPSSAFIILFVFGFIIGISLELLWSIIMKRRYGKRKGLQY